MESRPHAAVPAGSQDQLLALRQTGAGAHCGDVRRGRSGDPDSWNNRQRVGRILGRGNNDNRRIVIPNVRHLRTHGSDRNGNFPNSRLHGFAFPVDSSKYAERLVEDAGTRAGLLRGLLLASKSPVHGLLARVAPLVRVANIGPRKTSGLEGFQAYGYASAV